MNMDPKMCSACHGTGYSDGGEVPGEEDEEALEDEAKDDAPPPPEKKRKSFAQMLLARSSQ